MPEQQEQGPWQDFQPQQAAPQQGGPWEDFQPQQLPPAQQPSPATIPSAGTPAQQPPSPATPAAKPSPSPLEQFGSAIGGGLYSKKFGPEIPGTAKAWDIATGHRLPWEPPIGGKQPQPTPTQPQDTRPQVPSEVRPLLQGMQGPTAKSTEPEGMLVPGNLNLTDRPIIHNADGSISSEYSTSFGDEQAREVLVPTVVNGKFLTPDGTKPPEGSAAEKEMFKRAQEHYEKTGEHLGIFDTPQHADAYATQVHNRPLGGTRPMYVYRPTTQPRPKAGAQTTRIWDEFSGDTGLNKLADHVIAMEGDSRIARQNNNPGNLKDPKTGDFRKFGSYEEGRKALLQQLNRWRDVHPDWSIADFNAVYAPDKSRGGDNPEGTEDKRNRILMDAIRLAGGVEAKTKDQ